MAKPSPADLQRAKEAKQKKLLLILAPVLLALVAWHGPKSYKALTGAEAAPPERPAATTAPAAPTTPPPVGEGMPAAADGLPDTDPAPEALDGQLVTFSRFVTKDPFRGSPALGDGGGDGDADEPPESEGPPNTAVLAVNGDVESVSLGGAFPAGEPVFELVAIEGDTAEIGLVGGAFSNGAETIEVNVGETLVLVANPDGTRYAIKLVSVAYVPPA